MKRFHVFNFDQYYPGGGMEDFADSFETLEQAQEARRGQCWNIAETQADGSLKIVDGNEMRADVEYYGVKIQLLPLQGEAS